jgi:type I restriction enzyme S subunit
MNKKYRRLGDYIRPIDIRNAEGKEENLLGVTTQKYFFPSIANTVGTDFTNYKIVKRNQFTYVSDTSRRGDRIGIALLDNYDEGLVSNIYTVFEVMDTKKLLPEYLMLWFRRREFDRYARFKSHGSVREIFDWDEMCGVELPIPSIDRQKAIVKVYKTVADRIALKRKINENLISMLQTIYKKQFILGIEADSLPSGWHIAKLGDICSKIGSGATPTGGKTGYSSDGISLIRSMNVFDYEFSYNDLAHINDKQATALNNVTVQEHDVLFNITGVSVARCCMAPSNILPARVNQHVMIIRPIVGEYMSYYLLFTLCATNNKQRLLGIGQSGSTREAINKQEIENFEIIVPDMDVLQKFGNVASGLYKKMVNDTIEIEHLKEFQWMLLSRMAGKGEVA